MEQKYNLIKCCQYCGKRFAAKKITKKFCKDSCRVNHYKRRHGIPIPDFNMLSLMDITKNNLPSAKLKVKDFELHEINTKIKSFEYELSKHNNFIKQFDDDINKKIEQNLDIIKSHERSYHDNPGRFHATPTYKNLMEKIEMYRNNPGEDYYLKEKYKKYITSKEQKKILLKEIEKHTKEFSKVQLQFEALKSTADFKEFKQKSVFKINDLETKEVDFIAIDGYYKELLGNIAKGFICYLFGSKSSGKTIFTLKFVDYLSNFGKCIYYSIEEGLSDTMVLKLKALQLKNNFEISAEQNPKLILDSFKHYDFVVIDSITSSSIDVSELIYRLKNQNQRKTSLIAINHITRDKNMKGGTLMEHDPDIVIKLRDDHTPIIEKCRYDLRGLTTPEPPDFIQSTE